MSRPLTHEQAVALQATRKNHRGGVRPNKAKRAWAEFREEALDVIVALARQTKNPKVALDASREIILRSEGAAKQHVVIEGDAIPFSYVITPMVLALAESSEAE